MRQEKRFNSYFTQNNQLYVAGRLIPTDPPASKTSSTASHLRGFFISSKGTNMNINLGDTRWLIDEAGKAGLLRNQLAYLLATAYHETAHTMKPIKEQGSDKYLKSKKYYPYIGRGYAQITWKENYEKVAKLLNIDCVNKPDLLLKPEYAIPAIITGMKDGWFTGKKLSDYITLQRSDFKNARRIINGMDKADLIAEYARQYDKALLEIGYGVAQEVTAPANEVIPPPNVDKPVSKSSRLWSWLTAGGGSAALPFVDWKVQIIIVVGIIALAAYAIFTMPTVRAKFEKWIDAL